MEDSILYLGSNLSHIFQMTMCSENVYWHIWGFFFFFGDLINLILVTVQDRKQPSSLHSVWTVCVSVPVKEQ